MARGVVIWIKYESLRVVTRIKYEVVIKSKDCDEKYAAKAGGLKELLKGKVIKKVGDKTQEKVGDKTQEKVGDKTQEKVGDKTQEKVGDKTQEKVGDKTQEKVGDKTQEKVGDKTQEKGGGGSKEKSGCRSKEKGGERTFFVQCLTLEIIVYNIPITKRWLAFFFPLK
eukprot:466608_1